MDFSVKDKGIYAFGGFQLDPLRRTLSRDGVPVKLVQRLFDTLLYLVENPGRIVEKDELLGAVWGGRIVEEANLTRAISELRKLLQDDGAPDTLIVTAPGRGYRFATEVTRLGGSPAAHGVMAQRDAAQMSAPSHVTVEKAAQGRGRLAWGFAVAAAAASACVALAWFLWPAGTQKVPAETVFQPPPQSVAVMAFTNMTGDPAQDLLSDGLAEEIINSLGRVHGLRVAARMSSFTFKDKHAVADEIAHRLNVATILEGSVRRQGGHVRISAQLIDARTGYQDWSQSFDLDQDDILKIEGQIAISVTESLQMTLMDAAAGQLTLGGSANTQAFEAYLRGMKLMVPGEQSSFLAAVAQFDAAIALDPGFVLAYAQRADAIVQAGVLAAEDEPLPGIGPAKLWKAAALNAADRALAMAPELGIAHAARSHVLDVAFQDLAGAEKEAIRAVALAPGDAAVQMAYARLEIELGRVDAGVAAARLGASIDPLSSLTHARLAARLYYAHLPDEALAALRDAAALDPAGTLRDQDLLAAIQLMKRDWKAAQKTCAGELDWSQNQCLAIADHALGQQAEAEAQFAKVRKILGDATELAYADIEAQWGQRDEALRQLDALVGLTGGTAAVKEDPFLDPIRDDPAFKDILRRMNFPL